MIWLAFRGPSRERTYREEQALEHESESLEKKLRDAQGRAHAERQRAQERDREAARLKREAAQALVGEKAKANEESGKFATIVIAVVIFALFGGVAIWKNFFSDG